MTSFQRDPAQRFCECGKPLELYRVSSGNAALPIEWVKNGCGRNHYKKDKKLKEDTKEGRNEKA